LIVRGLGVDARAILASTLGGETRFLTDQEAVEIRRRWRTPDWSPDGRFRVVGDRNSLLLVPADDGPSRRIETPETGENSGATWSPDGQQIAFVGYLHEEGVTRLFLVRADGSGLRAPRGGGEIGSEPMWSPEGKRLAFEVDRTHSHEGTGIRIIRPDRSGATDLAGWHEGPDRRSAGDVSWIDSRTLVFSSRQHRTGPNRVADIHTIRSDGRGERRITYECHLGTGRADKINGSILADTIRAFSGDDEIGAGPGIDDVDAGPGADSIRTIDQARDIVRCGPGRDEVEADRRDRISRDCERVSVRAR
jgi:hypothetical protein